MSKTQTSPSGRFVMVPESPGKFLIKEGEATVGTVCFSAKGEPVINLTWSFGPTAFQFGNTKIDTAMMAAEKLVETAEEIAGKRLGGGVKFMERGV